MKVGIVVSPKERESTRLMEYARVISSSLEKRGYSSDIINTSLDADKKLIFYDYLIFLAETLSFFSKKLGPSLGTYLKNCGNISGKRTCLILSSSTLFKGGAMSSFMSQIEGEGVILKTSQNVSSSKEIEAFIKTINVERNY